MKALMHRIIVFGGLGLMLSIGGTACTLSGSNAAPLTTPVGLGESTPFTFPTESGVLPTFVMEETPGDVFADMTATALYDPFSMTAAPEGSTGFETLTPTPFDSGIVATSDPFLTTPFEMATVTPLPPLPVDTPTPGFIGAASTAAPGGSGTCPATYTVQSGDNLYRIALRFGLTYQELAAANGITNPDALPAGTVLKIPGCGGNPAPSGSTSSGGSVQPQAGDTVDANGDILHTVKSGENLFRIALNYGLNWEKVAAYNGINNPNDISVGQVIRIPRN
jgi:LysM repeat protein